MELQGSATVIILVAACAGYIFVTSFYPLKYKFARKSGHHLYLSVLVIGIPFTFASMLLGSILFKEGPTVFIFFICSAIASPYTLACLLNAFANRKQQAMWDTLSRDDLGWVLAHAIVEYKPIQVTLDTSKCYVGFVMDTLEPKDDNSYLSVLPIYSGYRDEKQQLILPNYYAEVANAITTSQDKSMADNHSELLHDYKIVIPKSRIVTCHIFNDHLLREMQNLA